MLCLKGDTDAIAEVIGTQNVSLWMWRPLLAGSGPSSSIPMDMKE